MLLVYPVANGSGRSFLLVIGRQRVSLWKGHTETFPIQRLEVLATMVSYYRFESNPDTSV